MKVPTDQATLLNAKSLFEPLHKLKLVHGNRGATVCEVFTAAGFLVIKTNTGDFKGAADGELWPPVRLTMTQVKQLAQIYAKSSEPANFHRTPKGLKVDTTFLPVRAPA